MWQFLRKNAFEIYIGIVMSLTLTMVFLISHEEGRKDGIEERYQVCVHLCELQNHTPKELKKCNLSCATQKYDKLYNRR